MSSLWGLGIVVGIAAALSALVAACGVAEKKTQRTQDELDRKRREWEKAQQQKREELERIQLQQSFEARQKSISIELSTLQNDFENFKTVRQTYKNTIQELSDTIRKSFNEKKKYKTQLSQMECPQIHIRDKVSKTFVSPQIDADIQEYIQKYKESLELIRDVAKRCQKLIRRKDDVKKSLDEVENIIIEIHNKICEKENELFNLTNSFSIAMNSNTDTITASQSQPDMREIMIAGWELSRLPTAAAKGSLTGSLSLQKGS